MTHLVNPVVRRFGMTTLLSVRGRVSGKVHTTPLGKPFEYGGARYLVSGRGQTQWARNLRAAGCGELRSGRISRSFRKGYFERIPDPADHPVFRIEPQPSLDP
jgi:hypothetical protein